MSALGSWVIDEALSSGNPHSRGDRAHGGGDHEQLATY